MAVKFVFLVPPSERDVCEIREICLHGGLVRLGRALARAAPPRFLTAHRSGQRAHDDPGRGTVTYTRVRRPGRLYWRDRICRACIGIAAGGWTNVGIELHGNDRGGKTILARNPGLSRPRFRLTLGQWRTGGLPVPPVLRPVPACSPAASMAAPPAPCVPWRVPLPPSSPPSSAPLSSLSPGYLPEPLPQPGSTRRRTACRTSAAPPPRPPIRVAAAQKAPRPGTQEWSTTATPCPPFAHRPGGLPTMASGFRRPPRPPCPRAQKACPRAGFSGRPPVAPQTVHRSGVRG
ncbi:hypothetical protein ACVKN3_001779 [Luteibacter sp. PvP120]